MGVEIKSEHSGQMANEMMEVQHHEQYLSFETEDPIVHEIDVLFNPPKDANSKVCVLQYPLRPCWRPYELDERCDEVRVLPATFKVEMDLSIDVDSKNYDKEVGCRMEMTKQTFSNEWGPIFPTDYAVGILVDDKLHLNPIHAVVQLRPSMRHLSSGAKKKNAVIADEGCTARPSTPELCLLKKQNERAETPFDPKSVIEERWVPLKFHGCRSGLSSQYLHKMTAKESSSIDFSMSRFDYVNTLFPGGDLMNVKAKSHSKRIWLTLSLEERLKKLLCEDPAFHRFNALKHFAPNSSAEDILSVLQEYALLVQGLWTVKTKLLNLDSALSFARDYALILLNRSTTITSSQVDAAGRNRDRVKEILCILATERPVLNDWKMKESVDVSFLKNYPDIVMTQEATLQNMENKVMSLIRGAKAAADRRKNIKASPDGTIKSEKLMNSSKRVAKSTTVSHPKRTMSEDTRKAIPEALKEVFQIHKVCSFQLICQGLRDLAISKCNKPKVDSSLEVIAAYGVDAPAEELKEVINEVATSIHGFYVLKSSPYHPEYDALRKVVINLLCGYGPDAKLKKAEVFEAGRSVLGREITFNEYSKVMNDLCESRGSAWILRKPK